MSHKKYELNNLYELVDRANTNFGDKTVYRFNRTKDEEVSVTYGEYYHYGE